MLGRAACRVDGILGRDERPRERGVKVRRFDIGDHVTWNSEAGRVSGHIVRVHEEDFPFKGYRHHASPDDPQYEIASDRTDHIAAHRGAALRLVDEHRGEG